MPHLTIEYSANAEDLVDMRALTGAVHEAALATGLFPIGGLRTRAVRRDIYEIADRHEDNLFLHLSVRIGAGRTAADRDQAAKDIFSALTGFLDQACNGAPLAVSMEVGEIDPDLSYKHNNIHDIVAQRREGQAS